MKLFNAIAAAAVIGTSFIAANPAEARNGWMRGGCNDRGECQYQKILSTSWPYVTIKNNTTSGMWTEVVDCQQWRYRETHRNGKPVQFDWADAMPGSIGEAKMRNACR